MSFEYKDYCKILAHLLQNFSTTLDWISFPQDGQLLLRHDVDIIPELCIPLADIEEKYRCRSTFFFLESNGIYSIYDIYTTRIINELIERGHKVQPHIDASLARSKVQLRSLVDEVCTRWERHFGFMPSCFSFHRPAGCNMLPVTPEQRWHPSVRCAYDGDIFLKALYISDSNHSIVSLDRIIQKVNEEKAVRCSLQLLTHPLWWAEKELTISEVKKRVHRMALNRVESILKDNISLYSNLG